MDKMKKRIYTISINDEIYDVIEIHGNDTEKIVSKIENLIKKFMWLNCGHNLKIWKTINYFHYYAADPKSGKHYDIKLSSVMLWTDNEINKYF